MRKSELLDALGRIGVSPSKRFGQNFMLDGNLLRFIAAKADISHGDNVLEIGPGCGALTELMLADGANLAALEIDKRLCDYLSAKFADVENFRLISGDACRVDIEKLLESSFASTDTAPVEWKCVANLPYSISSPFTAKLAALSNPPLKTLFLLQKETADRFTAEPGTKNYGSLSVVLQLTFEVKYLRTVSPEVFFPVPDVKSALVEFTLLPNPAPRKTREHVAKLVRTAFSQRRKKMIKALSAAYGKEICLEAYFKLELNENIRAEELPPGKFILLADILDARSKAERPQH